MLTACGVVRDIVDEACRLVVVHEVGGNPDADLLKDADYYQREGWAETQQRSR